MYHHRAESPANKPSDTRRWPEEEDIRYGYISADHLDGDKIAYVEQACEKEGNMEITCNERVYAASMVKPHFKRKLKGAIFIQMSKTDACQLKNLKGQFSVEIIVKFELKYSYFDRLHKAIELISSSTIQRLFPSDASCFSIPGENPPLFLSGKYQDRLTLDSSQIKALEMIVFAEPKAPVIVAGSFGTGKTQMLAQAAFQIFTAKYNDKPRVLVCAHHQASANSFLTKYFGPMKEEKEWKVSIARMIERKRMSEIEEPYRTKYCGTISYVARNLHRIQLVISTFGIALHLAEQLKDSLGDWFTHILIDEGAQTREPETIAPLSLCGPRTVIAIAGDHKQVSLIMMLIIIIIIIILLLAKIAIFA